MPDKIILTVAPVETAMKAEKSFYQALFSRCLNVKFLFKNTRIKKQEKELVAALSTIVGNPEKSKRLAEILHELRQKHHQHGAESEYYQTVISTLPDVMEEIDGERWWTDKIGNMWEQALNNAAATMVGAYRITED